MSNPLNQPSDSSEGDFNTPTHNENHDTAALGDPCGGARSGAQTAGDGRRGVFEDAMPSNTASLNSNPNTAEGEIFFQALRWGVDSLYLSYPGELDPLKGRELRKLKELAQSALEDQQVLAQLAINSHTFEVKDKGARSFPFIIEDNAFRIQLANVVSRMPLAYAKVSSDYLAHVSPLEAEADLHEVVSSLGVVKDVANASRIDLFVDFVTSVDIDGWPREAWVTRAKEKANYSLNDALTGWTIGQGGIVSARLYNKSLEIEVKKHKAYLRDLWREAGWDGSSPVWRLEFQLEREILTQHGLASFASAMHHLNGLWSYCTTEWLRLTIPQEADKTRSRWPIHPLWGYLSSIDWETSKIPLTRRYTHARLPSDDKLFSLSFSMLINFMAREGLSDLYDGLREFEAAMYSYQESRATNLGLPFDDYVSERIALKSRQFNTRLNPKPPEKSEEEIRQGAEAYRKASDGE